MKAVAIISGGLDSAVLAHWLRAEGFDFSTLSFDYGQRHRKELDFAKRLAAGLDVPWTVLDLHAAGLTALLSGSALTDAAVDVPDGHYAAENMRLTVVPNRNVIMLAIAAAAAASSGAGTVALAVHAGDHPIYPDCRPDFLTAFEEMERRALDGFAELRVLAPFQNKTKAEIVALGAELSVPFGETWSCYKGQEKHCGACGTCVERREAFALAGVKDPTTYTAFPIYAAP
jgi:7-cyano-7-deazaguanine synthase